MASCSPDSCGPSSGCPVTPGRRPAPWRCQVTNNHSSTRALACPFFGGGDQRVRLQLDLAGLRAWLGSGVVVLLRLHYLLSQRLEKIALPGVHDVSMHHPDVSELYLAADVMITDYSSAMVDFAVTGKPLLLFAYDLEHYRDVQRGFYVDLLADPPGPVLRSSDQVIADLADLDAVRERYAASYARFQDLYCSLEGEPVEHVWLADRRTWPASPPG